MWLNPTRGRSWFFTSVGLEVFPRKNPVSFNFCSFLSLLSSQTAAANRVSTCFQHFAKICQNTIHPPLEFCVLIFLSDDFSVFGSSFDVCLANLSTVLKRCEEVNLVLSWEKSHFMVQEGIVLGHKVSKKGIEVGQG